MPCYDDRDNPTNWVHQARLELELRKRCDELAALLCSAGRAYWAKKEMPQEVLIWWKHHCELDKSRGEPWDVE